MPQSKYRILGIATAFLIAALIAVIAYLVSTLGSTRKAQRASPYGLLLKGHCVKDSGQDELYKNVQQGARVINEGSKPLRSLSKGNEEFARRFYRVVVSGSGVGQNLVMSPLSASAIMAMASVGARGSTLTELRDALNLPCDEQSLLQGFQAFLSQILSPPSGGPKQNFSLSMANRMFVNDNFTVDPEFRRKSEEYFRASVTSLDFEDIDRAAQTINDWVEVNTNGKIKDLIQPGSIDAFTKLILVNAIYFKGSWNVPFDTTLTEKREFKGVQSTEDVYMMQLEDQFELGESKKLKSKILKLPYLGKRIAMYIILPNKGVSLADVEQKRLQMADFNELESSLQGTKVAVWLPRFKLEAEYELTEVFQSLGASEMFIPGKADFHGILNQDSNNGNPFFINEIVQKAFIEVNEEGTEAAAATGVNFRLASFAENFVCDKPFMFLIRDVVNEMTLFIGRYVQP